MNSGTNERKYILGYYKQKLSGNSWLVTTETVIMSNLYPMTHKQACVMKSKMSNPNNFFLVEV
jgi:hypothetical protein